MEAFARLRVAGVLRRDDGWRVRLDLRWPGGHRSQDSRSAPRGSAGGVGGGRVRCLFFLFSFVVHSARGATDDRVRPWLEALGEVSLVVALEAAPKSYASIREACASRGAALAFYPLNAPEPARERVQETLRRFVESTFTAAPFLNDELPPIGDEAQTLPTFFSPKEKPPSFATRNNNIDDDDLSRVEPVTDDDDPIDDDDDDDDGPWLRDLKARADATQVKTDPKLDNDHLAPRTPCVFIFPVLSHDTYRPRPSGEEPSADSGHVRSFFEGLLTGNTVSLTPTTTTAAGPAASSSATKG